MKQARLYRVQLAHKAYSQSLDWKSSVRQLHRAVIRFAHKAEAEVDKLGRFRLELKAQHALDYLILNLNNARSRRRVDPVVCDRLLMVYHSCSLLLAQMRYKEAAALIEPIFRIKGGCR